MALLASIQVALVALIHLYILNLEMFAWTTRGPKIFASFPRDLFEPTRVMAANQGLYNGFLAAGLLWSFFTTNAAWQSIVRLFFRGCVAVAGLYAAYSAEKKSCGYKPYRLPLLSQRCSCVKVFF